MARSDLRNIPHGERLALPFSTFPDRTTVRFGGLITLGYQAAEPYCPS